MSPGPTSRDLAQLQLSFRQNLERRRRAATTIWRAAERRRSLLEGGSSYTHSEELCEQGS